MAKKYSRVYYDPHFGEWWVWEVGSNKPLRLHGIVKAAEATGLPTSIFRQVYQNPREFLYL